MYAKLDHVLTYLPQNLRKQYADDDTLKSYAWKAIEHLDFPDLKMSNAFDLFDIVNHKVALPEGITQIKSVYLYDGGLTADQIEILYQDCDDCEDEDLNLNCMPLYHRIFVANPEIANHFLPVYHAGKVSDKILCLTRKCPDYSFSVNPGMTTMTVSEKTGVIAINWREYLKEDGNFMLPRHPAVVWEYMSAYIKMMIHEDLQNWNMYKNYQQEMASYLTEARGALNLRSFNFRAQKEIVYSSSKIVKINQTLHENYNKYGKL